MTSPSHSHGAWVARTRSEVIPEGDAVPSTHTPHTATPDRKVAADISIAAPLPFVARHPGNQRILALAIILVTVAMATVPTWIITRDLATTAAMAGIVALFGLGLAAPGLAGVTNPVDRALAERERSA